MSHARTGLLRAAAAVTLGLTLASSFGVSAALAEGETDEPGTATSAPSNTAVPTEPGHEPDPAPSPTETTQPSPSPTATEVDGEPGNPKPSEPVTDPVPGGDASTPPQNHSGQGNGGQGNSGQGNGGQGSGGQGNAGQQGSGNQSGGQQGNTGGSATLVPADQPHGSRGPGSQIQVSPASTTSAPQPSATPDLAGTGSDALAPLAAAGAVTLTAGVLLLRRRVARTDRIR